MILAQTKTFMLPATNAARSLWKSACPTYCRELIASGLSDFLATFATWNLPSRFLGLLVTGVTESKKPSPGAVASLACFDRISASLTQSQSVLGKIRSFPYRLSAFITGCSIVCKRLSMPVVVFYTKSKTKVWTVAQLAVSFRDKLYVQLPMLRMVRKYLKVLWSVILFIKVNVVDFFWGNKESSQIHFSYDPMFGNESLCVGPWMIVGENHHISTMIDIPSSFVSGLHVFGNLSASYLDVNTIHLTRDQT